MKSLLALGLIFFAISASAAEPREKVTGMYSQSDFGDSYTENDYRLIGEVPTRQWARLNSYLGYAGGHRQYTKGEAFDKNSLLFGTTWMPEKSPTYWEFSGLLSDTGVIGAKSSLSLVGHSTHFQNFDLGFGVESSTYETGDVFTLKPSILYFYKNFMFGHGSWIFFDDGPHWAWRNFVRARQYDKWEEEFAISGGESREDVGLIDNFWAYSLSVRRYYNHWDLGGNVEFYQGDVRKGFTWGLRVTWLR